jgi:hypothetical protein
MSFAGSAHAGNRPSVRVGHGPRPAHRGRRAVLLALILCACAPATSARGADLFTLDTRAASFAPVVVDSAGNGYVAWLRAGAPGDVMFCKLPRGARGCAAPVVLAPPGGAPTDEASQPFPIVTSDFIYVVAPRYVDNDTLIYRSADGGRTFSVYVVPVGSYSNMTSPDDVIPTNTNGTPYSGGPTSGGGALYFQVGASNPGLGFSYSTWGMFFPPETGVPSELSFSNVGPGLVGGSTLGVTGSGELVAAYWLDSTPPTVAFFAYSYNKSRPSFEQRFWLGPRTVVSDGYLPRLSGGPAGLFMLSAQGTSSTPTPSKVEVRRYDPASQTFTGATGVLALAPGQASLFDGGGLDQNGTTGELVAVWPAFAGSSTAMRLYVSTNAGASFSGGQEIASVGRGYAVNDNARVAVAADGSGFLTFRDAGGVKVADLYPLAKGFSVLSVRGGAVYAPFTCTAPHGSCRVLASITAGGGHAAARRAGVLLASGAFTVVAGTAKKLKIGLTAAGRRALRAHRRVKATLTLTQTGTGARHTTLAPVAIG